IEKGLLLDSPVLVDDAHAPHTLGDEQAACAVIRAPDVRRVVEAVGDLHEGDLRAPRQLAARPRDFVLGLRDSGPVRLRREPTRTTHQPDEDNSIPHTRLSTYHSRYCFFLPAPPRPPPPPSVRSQLGSACDL